MRYSWHSGVLACGLFLVGCGEVLPAQPDADIPPVDADPCTGVCECRVDDDCSAAHTACNDQITSRTCDCVAGYIKGLAGECEFSGIVQDPGFQSTSVWSTGAATIDVNLNEVGMVEPGAAKFSGAGLCDLARITQTVKMPRLSRAEPLVAQITYRGRDPNFFDLPTPAVGIGPGWQDALPTHNQTFRTARVCLGAGQYAPESSTGLGVDLEFAVMPNRPPTFGQCTDANLTLDIDRIEVVLANPDECPAPGGAINADLEGTGGWVIAGSSANGNPFSATIEPNVGEANSRGIRLFARNRCSNLSARNIISIPTAEGVASPALSFFNRTSAGLPGIDTEPRLGGITLPAIIATGSAITQRVCVPASMRGGAFEFGAFMNIDGTCAEQPNAESIIDSLKLVNEPGCGDDPLIADPGFEAANVSLIGARSTPGKSLARRLDDPAQAHGGRGVLQLSVSQLCDGPSWVTSVVVPPASGAAGPALKFFYKASPAANYSFAVNAAAGATFTPTLDNAYHEGVICLNPKLVGRAQTVTFRMSGGSGTCANTHPAETAFVDDLSVTTDAACPAM